MVKDPEILNQLQYLKAPINFHVPIIFAPSGLQTLSRQDLLNLLEQIDQAPVSELPVAEVSAPI